MSPFDKARANLTELVYQQSYGLAQHYGQSYVADKGAPETYGGIIAEAKRMKEGNAFRVSPDNSESTIYLSADANHAFRHWHDLLHYEGRYDLSFHGELMVAYEHLAVVARAFGANSPEHRLMRIDTIGQLNYLQATGNFVSDQLAFAKEQFSMTTYQTCYMSVGGQEGWAVQRNHNGEVRYYGGVLGPFVYPYHDAECKASTAQSLLPLLGPEKDWVERKGEHADSKKPATAFPPMMVRQAQVA